MHLTRLSTSGSGWLVSVLYKKKINRLHFYATINETNVNQLSGNKHLQEHRKIIMTFYYYFEHSISVLCTVLILWHNQKAFIKTKNEEKQSIILNTTFDRVPK